MGAGGAALHEWIFDPDPVDAEQVKDMFATAGAVVLGRRTFEVGVGRWNDTPYPAPSFVVTHRPEPERPMKSGRFVFLPDLAEAAERARAAAGEANVVLMGAEITRQALAAGLVDELRVQIAPRLLGSGTPLFAGTEPRPLERTDARVSRNVVHLRYRMAPGV